MSIRTRFCRILILLASILAGFLSRAEPKLLFHATFDETPVALVAEGRKSPLIAENLSYAPGKSGTAVRIDPAARPRLEYALEGNMDMRKGSLSVWVRREWLANTTASYHGLFSTDFPQDRIGTGAIAFWFLNGMLRADVSDFGDKYFTRVIAPANGQWEHLVLNWDGADIGIAINGRLVNHFPAGADKIDEASRAAYESYSFKRRAFDRFYVGSRQGLFPFGGLIDELRIYSEPLSETNIRQIFNLHATDAERVADMRPDYARAFASHPVNPYAGKPSADADPAMDLELVEMVELNAVQVETLVRSSRFKAIGGTSQKHLDGRSYLEAGENENSRYAVRFTLDAAAPLHLFEIDYPDDRMRTMDMIVQDSKNEKWDGTPGADYTLQVGVLTGGVAPISGRMLTHKCVYWTRASDVSLCVMTARRGQPAAISRIKVWKIKDGRLPPLKVTRPQPKNGWNRQIAMYFEDPAISYGFPTPDHATTARGMLDLVQRTSALMKFAGETMLVYPGAWYGGYMDEAYNPRSHAPNFLAAWYEGFDREGLNLIPAIGTWTIPYRGKPVTPDTARDGSLHDTPVSILDTGMPKLGGAHGSNPQYNIVHPATQAYLEFIVDSMLNQGAEHPSFKGICIHFGRTAVSTFGSSQSGYNDYAIEAFEKACDVKIDVDRKDPLRGKLYAEWLRARPEAYRQWLDWRCRVLADFWGRMARKMSARRGDLKLWFNCYPMTAVTREEFLNADFAREMVRDAGVDADMLVKAAPNIVVSPCIVPADYRWRNPESMPKNRRELRLMKNRDYYKMPESFCFCAKEESFPWNAYHDLYWESAVGGDGSVCGRGKAGKEEDTLNSPWLRECRWRVTALNPAGRHALAHLVAPFRFKDVLGISKGGFLIGTYGMEGPLREFSAAFQALPAVKMEEFFRKGDVVGRTVDFDGRRYFYLVNTGDSPSTLAFEFPPDTRNIVTGEVVSGCTAITLAPYEMRSYEY